MSQHNDSNTNDGIVELDNRLPNWWLGTLYGTIIFSMIYFFYYTFGNGPTLTQEYDRAHAAREYEAYQNRKPAPPITHASLAAIIKDDSRVKAGQAVFQGKCVSCHGAQGEGGIGPNLTDDHWVHGGQLEQIALTITNGVLDKGMPAWGSVLEGQDVSSLVVYIRSLRGTKPAGAKAPQGELVTIKD